MSKAIELNPIALVIWLLLRGLYIWFLVPIGALAGLLAYPLLRKHGATIPQLIAWLDLNAMAALFHSVFRPLRNSTLVPWTRLRDLASITHRFTNFTSF